MNSRGAVADIIAQPLLKIQGGISHIEKRKNLSQ